MSFIVMMMMISILYVNFVLFHYFIRVLTTGKLKGPMTDAKPIVGEDVDSPIMARTAGGLKQDILLNVSS